MTQETFAVFKKFSDPERAKMLATILEENGISVQLVNNSPVVDITFTGNTLQNETEVKIAQSDFEKARQLLEQDTDIDLNKIDKDYYLFDFTDDELYDVLLEWNEWSEYDLIVSKKILQSRGQEVTDAMIESLRTQKLDELAKPEENKNLWIFLGYMFALLGGLLGMFIGYMLWKHRKTLPDGTKVFTHNERDRRHGKFIFFIGLIVFSIAFTIRIMPK